MSKKVWLITGAGRGMGVDFARAALASGHSVVASGRNLERVSRSYERRFILARPAYAGELGAGRGRSRVTGAKRT